MTQEGNDGVMPSKENCEHCNMERVVPSQLLSCTWMSICGLYIDIVQDGKPLLHALVLNDRVLYLVGILAVLLAVSG